ncbi:MAG: complex I NDUFA9 subunit family protein [Gammaproteobacteria bacterium]|nr:complex I NDUFA9 subunit family protein [Gammaproteobacteria bacterium]
MEKRTVCVLGGTGFVGRHLVGELTKVGYFVRVLSRKRERHRELLVLPGVSVINANVYNSKELNRHLAGVSIVINLVGILNQRGHNNSFNVSHIELTEKIIAACKKNNIRRLLHMSALNADAEKGASKYLKSKGVAENLAHDAQGINVTSFRPSVIFGPDDDFFNRFASLLKITPSIFPLACPKSKFAPVYIGDVVSCFVKAINNQNTYGQRYELCGPEVYSLKQLVEFTASQIGVKRRVVGLGHGLSNLQACVLELLPTKPFSRDNYKSLQVDSICDEAFPAIFNTIPKSVEAVMPKYLALKNSRGRYYDYRANARRN